MSFENINNLEYASLFQELLNKDIILRIKVTGESMKPFLKDGDIVIIKKACSKEINIGDLILFRNNNGFTVLHRVISRKRNHKGKIEFTTKGDRLISSDEPIIEENVLGKVVKIEKHFNDKVIKSINLESSIWKTLNCLIVIFSLLKTRFLKQHLTEKF